MARRNDQFWDHVEKMDNHLKCKFCDLKYAVSTSISRIKYHLSGVQRHGVKICEKVPKDVQEAAYLAIHGPNKKLSIMPGRIQNLQMETQGREQEVGEERTSLHAEAGNDFGNMTRVRTEQPLSPGTLAWMDGLMGEIEFMEKGRVPAGIGFEVRHGRRKLEVYNEVLKRIQERNFEEANLPGFYDHLLIHFNRLPHRYALDVNVERAEDVLRHKRLLQLAEDPANRPTFEVRLVQMPEHPVSNGNSIDLVQSDCRMENGAQNCNVSVRQGKHPPPTFGFLNDGDCAVNSTSQLSRLMHEITFSTVDKPKVTSQEIEELRNALEMELLKSKVGSSDKETPLMTDRLQHLFGGDAVLPPEHRQSDRVSASRNPPETLQMIPHTPLPFPQHVIHPRTLTDGVQPTFHTPQAAPPQASVPVTPYCLDAFDMHGADGKVLFHEFWVNKDHLSHLQRLEKYDGTFWANCVVTEQKIVGDLIYRLGEALMYCGDTSRTRTSRELDFCFRTFESVLAVGFSSPLLSTSLDKVQRMLSDSRAAERASEIKQMMRDLQADLDKLESQSTSSRPYSDIVYDDFHT